jgi:hypothetical protein
MSLQKIACLVTRVIIKGISEPITLTEQPQEVDNITT